MKFDNFTIKSQEAVQKALEMAANGGQQAVGTLHLLAGVLAVGENVTQFLFGKTGVNTASLQEVVNKRLQALPRVQGGGEPYLERDANEVLLRSQQVAKQMGDTFVGLEPLLMALLEVKSEASVLLKEQGLTAEALRQAVNELRGGRKADSASSEETYQALSKYARNLVDEAREGKLDPVIGRDEEIRRVLQILSRRTKNNPILIGEPGTGKTAIVEGVDSLTGAPVKACDLRAGAAAAGPLYHPRGVPTQLLLRQSHPDDGLSGV